MLVRAAVIATLAASPAAAQAPLKSQFDALLAASYPADGPGATMIVTKGGVPIYTGARGMADVAAKRALTPDSVIRIGSITKQFTAAIILQLVGEGRLSLDDPLSKFYPAYPAPGAAVTVRQLLNHTSGIQSYTGIPGWMVAANTGRAFTTDALIAEFRDRPATFPAGSKWDYNNSGYVLLGGIIEKVTGRPWYEAVDRRIAKPLGLATVRFGNPPASAAEARPYTLGGAPAQAVDMSVPGAAGGLVGSVGDVAKWAQALHHGKVVRPALYAQMIAPTTLGDGTTNPYGFGLSNASVRGAGALTHSGGIFGGATDSLYVPSEDLFVAVFANTDAPQTAPGLVMRRAAALAMGKPYASLPRMPVDMAAVAPMLGVYAIAGGGDTRVFYAEGGALFSRRGSGAPVAVFPAGDGRFALANSLTWFRVVPQAGGYAMEMHPGGEDAVERATRTGPPPAQAAAITLPRAALERVVGKYDVGPFVADVRMEGERLVTQIPGQPAFPLEPTSPTEFRLVGVPAVLVLDGERMTIRQGGREMTGARVR